MKKNIKVIGALLALVHIASGCASILSKESYPVKFNSSPVGLTVEVVNRESGQVVQRGVTPTQFILNASDGAFSSAKYTVNFKQGSKVISSQPLNSTVDGWFVGNIVIGGIIGMVIDAGTGSMWKLPKSVDMVNQGSANHIGLRFFNYNDLTQEQKSTLIPVR